MSAGAPGARAADDVAASLDRLDREIRSLDLELRCTPNPVELPLVATAITVRVDALVNEAARLRVNEAFAVMRARAQELGGADAPTDVRLVQECRWTVNGAAWGRTVATRVTEILPSPGWTLMQFTKEGVAPVVVDIEWRVERVRAERPKDDAGLAVWNFERVRADLDRSVAARAVASISIVRASAAPMPLAVAMEGPDRVEADTEVELRARVSVLYPDAKTLASRSRIEWLIGRDVVGVGESFRFSAGTPGPRQIRVRVVSQGADVRTVLAAQSRTIGVVPPAGEPSLSLAITGADSAWTGGVVVLVAEARAMNAAGKYVLPQTRIVWSGGGRVLGEGDRLAVSASLPGSQTIVAMLVKQGRERRAVLQTARHSLDVVSEPVRIAAPAGTAVAATEETHTLQATAEISRAKKAELEARQQREEETRKLAEERRLKEEADARATAAAEALRAKQAELDAAQQRAEEARAAESLRLKQEADAQAAAAAEALRAKQAELDAVHQREQEARKLAVEKRLKEDADRRLDRAQELVNDGYALERRGDSAAAMVKYEAAGKLVPDAKLTAHVDDLRKQMAEAQAQELIVQGYEFEKSGDTARAIDNYEKAIVLFPDDRVAAHVKILRSP